MTALDDFDRLEAVGQLQRTSQESPREVLVTFGEATLTMHELKSSGDIPLAHWSLGAIEKSQSRGELTIYRLSGNHEETLTIDDVTLRDALDKVLAERQPPKEEKRTQRSLWRPALVVCGALAAYFVLPSLVLSTARNMISPERAALLTSDMVAEIEARTGPPCTTPLADVALERLARRLDPNGISKLAVQDLGDADVISFPDGQVFLGAHVLQKTRSNAEIAAWAAVGIAGVIDSPALDKLFDEGGIMDGFRFLSQGELPESSKKRAVDYMLTNTVSINAATAENASVMLQNARLSTSGLDQILMQQQVSTEISDQTPIMTDQEWSALRNVCRG